MLSDEKPLRCVEGLVMRQREWNQNEECFRLCPHPIACQLKRRKSTMNLTQHFTLDELTFSPTAERQKIKNTPPLEVVAHLTTLAVGLEKVRALLGAGAALPLSAVYSKTGSKVINSAVNKGAIPARNALQRLLADNPNISRNVGSSTLAELVRN